MTNKEILDELIKTFTESDEYKNLQRLHFHIIQDQLIYGQCFVDQELLDKYNVKTPFDDIAKILEKVYDKSNN